MRVSVIIMVPDAQTIFDQQVPTDALEIEIFVLTTSYSKKLGRVVMMNEAEDHTKNFFCYQEPKCDKCREGHRTNVRVLSS